MKKILILLIFIFVSCEKPETVEPYTKFKPSNTEQDCSKLFKPGYMTTCDSLFFRVREHIYKEVCNCEEVAEQLRSQFSDDVVFRFRGVSYDKNNFIFCENN